MHGLTLYRIMFTDQRGTEHTEHAYGLSDAATQQYTHTQQGEHCVVQEKQGNKPWHTLRLAA